jgi:polysaccharide export outer membrane protein
MPLGFMTNRLPLFGFYSCILVSLLLMRTSAFGADTSPGDARRLAPLGPGDTISIQVYNQPEMNGTVYIGDNGTVSLPLAGAVRVAGLSPVEAATQIERALKNGQYLIDPHVTVAVLVSKSQRVSVVGEVRTPGSYTLDPGSSVRELVAQAGGLDDVAADVGYIVRRDGAGKETRYPFNTRPSAVAGKDSDPAAVRPQSGDSIEVPAAAQFYIYGEVTTPSKYRIEPGMTVIQAIARAGGITPRGSERRVDIKRLGGNGNYITIHAKASDLVKPNDVIRVKESIF